ncbi:hypothetical protein ACFX58_03560 [Sphingomonas sp. NCPPB 2930]
MKPRLKRARDGSIAVLVVGSNPWAEPSVKKFICEHYGSLATFARRYHFSYRAVCTALTERQRPEKMAGQVALVRQVLGLISQPTHQAMVTAKSKRWSK